MILMNLDFGVVSTKMYAYLQDRPKLHRAMSPDVYTILCILFTLVDNFTHLLLFHVDHFPIILFLNCPFQFVLIYLIHTRTLIKIILINFTVGLPLLY